MEVILHVGAHRCATTTFQHYLRSNAAWLGARGIGFWGPRRTRGGLLRGVVPRPGPAPRRDLQARATGRVRMRLGVCAASGVETLLVSDENMLGFLRENRAGADLYPAAGERIARFAAAFGGRLGAVVLNVRALDLYWASALGYGAVRGFGLPGAAMLDRLAHGPRGWREVVGDIACAVPQTPVLVAPFERFAGRPEAQLAAITGRSAPLAHARERLNATPRLDGFRARLIPEDAARLPPGEGRWQPFTPAQAGALRERYADDLMWLGAGAGGLARLLPDGPCEQQAGINPQMTMTRGRRDDQPNRNVAGAG
ncbi:MAG: hypothetical protein ACK5MY_03400 [Jhaorihella sp.]